VLIEAEVAQDVSEIDDEKVLKGSLVSI